MGQAVHWLAMLSNEILGGRLISTMRAYLFVYSALLLVPDVPDEALMTLEAILQLLLNLLGPARFQGLSRRCWWGVDVPYQVPLSARWTFYAEAACAPSGSANWP